MSEKRNKFLELAEKRVNNALKQIVLIGNLSNKNVYEYTDDEIKKIFKVLKDELKIAEMRFSDSPKRKFRL